MPVKMSPKVINLGNSPNGPGPLIDRSLVDYVDILFSLMDINITYEKFHSMNKEQRLQFARNLKIKKILD
jgi:hypothetical protein